jgi:hypothetical protein
MLALKRLKQEVYLPTLNVTHTHTLRYAATSPKIWLFTVLISDFNKEQYELPEDDLKWIETCWSVLSVLTQPY